MAILKDNLLLHSVSGHIGKQLVYKNYGGKTVVSKFPDMSKVVPSKKQLAAKSHFAEAQRFAKGVIADPVKKAAYEKKYGRPAYQAAIAEYLGKNKQTDGTPEPGNS